MTPQLREYLNILYNPEDHVWISDRKINYYQSISVQEVTRLEGLSSFDGVYISLHTAVGEGLHRKSENVKDEFRSFLIELDDTPIDQQIGLIDKYGIPISSITFSGKKSYHFVVSLEDPVDFETYSELFVKLSLIISEMDSSVRDRVRFTRFPNGIRDGIDQELIFVGSRVLNASFCEFINAPENRLKWEIPTAKTKAKTKAKTGSVVQKFNSSRPKTDRTEIVRLLKWYVTQYQKSEIQPFNFKVACPVCSKCGADTAGDNLHITTPDLVFHCFADDEHDKLVIAELRRLKRKK